MRAKELSKSPLAKPNGVTEMSDAEWVKLGEQLDIVWKKMSRVDDPPERLHRQLESISNKITRTPATSLAGLRAKTKFAVIACEPWWKTRMKSLEWEAEHARSVIEAACVLTGLPVPEDRSERELDPRLLRLRPSSETLN